MSNPSPGGPAPVTQPSDATSPDPASLVFLGTPDAAVPPLRALVAAEMAPVLVVSRADQRRRRRGEPEPSPVKAAALEFGLPVTHEVGDVVGSGADLGVVVAFGEIIRQPVLDAVPMINVHFSLLPRWRGAAPVERAILAGDETTGVAIMEVVAALDAGGVYASEEVAIGPDERAAELRNRLVEVGCKLLIATLQTGLGDPVPQAGEPVYAHKIEADDLHLDWAQPAIELYRICRVGGAWTTFRGDRFKIHRAHLASPPESVGHGARPPGAIVDGRVATGDGWLELVDVQPSGKPVMAADAWRNGARPTDADLLGA